MLKSSWHIHTLSSLWWTIFTIALFALASNGEEGFTLFIRIALSLVAGSLIAIALFKRKEPNKDFFRIIIPCLAGLVVGGILIVLLM
ncbi:MAG: hypothetical protein ABH800_02020 [Candidatus Nealsonbacteria bacterium]